LKKILKFSTTDLPRPAATGAGTAGGQDKKDEMRMTAKNENAK
jgi:hypothetical protein